MDTESLLDEAAELRSRIAELENENEDLRDELYKKLALLDELSQGLASLRDNAKELWFKV